MNELEVRIQLLHGAARMPTRAYASDSGWDCYACFDTVLAPGDRAIVGFGFAAAPPIDHELQVRPRSSSLLHRGLHVAFGTNDSGYRGEVGAVVLNTGTSTQTICAGERVAQFVISPVPRVRLVQVGKLPVGDRGGAGFGSSGL